MDALCEPRGTARKRRESLRALPPAEIHVWQIPLGVDDEKRARCEAVLSESEKIRGAAFHRACDRTRFVVSHGCLRHILALYADEEPGELEFVISEFGKPHLRRGKGGVRFNMAHSEDVALVAVSGGSEVGVDIESLRKMDDLILVAERCFSPRELSLLRACRGSEEIDLFYTLWTRKEAYIKARGEGMSLDLTAVEIPRAPAVLNGRWHVRDLGVYMGCRCALAADGPMAGVRMLSADAAMGRKGYQNLTGAGR